MHIVPLFLTAAIVGLLLVLNEFWVRRRSNPSELSRKFIHISVGSFVAFWPFFLSWTQILLMSLAFIVVVLLSKTFHVFTAIHSVQRPTYGELFFAMAVGLVAIVTHSRGIYAAALLQMSLADGLAAVSGIHFGAGSRYKVLGATKSVVGTTTFFIVSVLLLVGYSYFANAPLSAPLVIGLALGASALENIGIYGLDNLFVPLLIAAVLGSLA